MQAQPHPLPRAICVWVWSQKNLEAEVQAEQMQENGELKASMDL